MLWLQKVCLGLLVVLSNPNVSQIGCLRMNNFSIPPKTTFNFVTRFFEPINASATHIYHSALELSPLSPIVQKLYYYHHPTPFPRVLTGILNSWDPSITITVEGNSHSTTWTLCGQFVTTQTREGVEIQDPSTLESLSTFQPDEQTPPPTLELLSTPQSNESIPPLRGPLAYLPDRCFLACVTITATIVIWDAQTVGVAKEIHCDGTLNDSLAWSLDGRMIGTVYWTGNSTAAVHIYDVVSCTKLSPIMLQSHNEPHF